MVWTCSLLARPVPTHSTFDFGGGELHDAQIMNRRAGNGRAAGLTEKQRGLRVDVDEDDFRASQCRMSLINDIRELAMNKSQTFT